jgi:hypothetical protein
VFLPPYPGKGVFYVVKTSLVSKTSLVLPTV